MKILYIAHSSERIHRRTAYAILSCLQIHGGTPPCPVELVTDTPEFYAPLTPHIEIISVEPALIADWHRAAGGYPLATKTEVLARQKDSFLFLDGDTVLLRPLPPLLTQIGPGISVFQKREYRLGPRPDYRTLVADPAFPDYTSRTVMYNSGMLGVHRENLPILQQARDMTFAIFAKHPIRPIDQLVVATMLGKRTRILTAASQIYHYWQDKAFPDAFMDRFFDGMGLAEMVRRVAGGDGAPLFALGFRRNPFLYDLYMRATARVDMLTERFRRPCPF